MLSKNTSKGHGLWKRRECTAYDKRLAAAWMHEARRLRNPIREITTAGRCTFHSSVRSFVEEETLCMPAGSPSLLTAIDRSTSEARRAEATTEQRLGNHRTRRPVDRAVVVVWAPCVYGWRWKKARRRWIQQHACQSCNPCHTQIKAGRGTWYTWKLLVWFNSIVFSFLTAGRHIQFYHLHAWSRKQHRIIGWTTDGCKMTSRSCAGSRRRPTRSFEMRYATKEGIA